MGIIFICFIFIFPCLPSLQRLSLRMRSALVFNAQSQRVGINLMQRIMQPHMLQQPLVLRAGEQLICPENVLPISLGSVLRVRRLLVWMSKSVFFIFFMFVHLLHVRASAGFTPCGCVPVYTLIGLSRFFERFGRSRLGAEVSV